jgi:hypothetical protein
VLAQPEQRAVQYLEYRQRAAGRGEDDQQRYQGLMN